MNEQRTSLPTADNTAVHGSVASIRRADLRFLSPAFVRSAALAGALPEWREGLERAGISLSDNPSRSPDFVVGESRCAEEALRIGGRVVILEGLKRTRALAAAGYVPRSYVLRPSLDDPSLVIPLEHPAATRYAVIHATASASGWKRGRNALAAALLQRGIVPPGLRSLAMGFKQAGPPLIISAAAALGVPRNAEWYLTLGRGDQLSRNVFHLFEPGSESPFAATATRSTATNTACKWRPPSRALQDTPPGSSDGSRSKAFFRRSRRPRMASF